MTLAGRAESELFDRLAAAQLDLARGEDGHDRYLTCPNATLSKIVITSYSIHYTKLYDFLGELTVFGVGAFFTECTAFPNQAERLVVAFQK